RSRIEYQQLFAVFKDERFRLARILRYMGALPAREELTKGKKEESNILPIEVVKEQEISEEKFTETKTEKRENLLDKVENKSGSESSELKTNLPEPKKSDISKIQKSIESKYIRVDAYKLDQLINLVGELVITGANLQQVSNEKKIADLSEVTQSMTHLISEIREGALKLRMVQVGDTFNRFQRTVRDIGQELDKKINFKISGGDTELDKTVIEKINDPLMHLIRNAIDHGIESSEERKRIGKPEEGTLSLNAYHETGYIVIEVSDDGKGLDPEKIIGKALEKGIIRSATEISKNSAVDLIFKPGFSTASKVTNLSGRGVGLDVVQKNIEALRGAINVETEIGKGTRFIIRLPLTLAIIEGFLVKVSDSFYVVPLDIVVECLEYKEEYKSKNKDYINLRGELLPFIKIHELFHLKLNPNSRKN
ncbi:MAG: chemotaxis protein CheA, partial [Leptospiraceae bacterium]|nr:chemotaxis protein CheA [Leptospiraceae bacterium]